MIFQCKSKLTLSARFECHFRKTMQPYIKSAMANADCWVICSFLFDMRRILYDIYAQVFTLYNIVLAYDMKFAFQIECSFLWREFHFVNWKCLSICITLNHSCAMYFQGICPFAFPLKIWNFEKKCLIIFWSGFLCCGIWMTFNRG